MYSGLYSVPLPSAVTLKTPTTSSLASAASWKAGSGSGDGVSGLSVAGDDLLLLIYTEHIHRRKDYNRTLTAEIWELIM